VNSVTLDSRDVTAVEAVAGGVPEALVSAGGAPGLLVFVDSGADEAGVVLVDSGGIEESEAGGAGGGEENSVEAAGGRNGVLD
jgi:hypothetical protein